MYLHEFSAKVLQTTIWRRLSVNALHGVMEWERLKDILYFVDRVSCVFSKIQYLHFYLSAFSVLNFKNPYPRDFSIALVLYQHHLRESPTPPMKYRYRVLFGWKLWRQRLKIGSSKKWRWWHCHFKNCFYDSGCMFNCRL